MKSYRIICHILTCHILLYVIYLHVIYSRIKSCEKDEYGVQNAPPNGEAGAWWREPVGTFFSTEFNEPRLDAKAEKGDAGTEFMKLPVSRLQTRAMCTNVDEKTLKSHEM